MKKIAILLMLVILLAGCIENTTTTTLVTTTMPTTTEPTTTTESTTTTTAAETTTTIGETTTTTIESIEKGIAIVSTTGGVITIKHIGKVQEMLTSEIDLYINEEQVEPIWTFTIIYPTNIIKSRATCSDGDNIRVVAPGNEDTASCVE